MLSDIGIIVGMVSGAIVIIVTIIGIAKGGWNIFGKINKIENIEKATNALLLIHRNELFELYKNQIKIVFNPTSDTSPDRDYLLERLRTGYLMPEEAQRLTGILRYEEDEAKRKDQQIAVLVIGALLLLVALASKK